MAPPATSGVRSRSESSYTAGADAVATSRRIMPMSCATTGAPIAQWHQTAPTTPLPYRTGHAASTACPSLRGPTARPVSRARDATASWPVLGTAAPACATVSGSLRWLVTKATVDAASRSRTSADARARFNAPSSTSWHTRRTSRKVSTIAGSAVGSVGAASSWERRSSASSPSTAIRAARASSSRRCAIRQRASVHWAAVCSGPGTVNRTLQRAVASASSRRPPACRLRARSSSSSGPATRSSTLVSWT